MILNIFYKKILIFVIRNFKNYIFLNYMNFSERDETQKKKKKNSLNIFEHMMTSQK